MDTKYQFWLEYNSSMDSFFALGALLAGMIVGLIWLVPRLKLSQTTWAITGFTAIRIPFLFDSLWYDEAFTAWLSGLPFGNMLAATAGDVHPPLWYIIEWGAVRVFGSSDLALRFPALALSALTVWLHLRLCDTWGLPPRLKWVSFGLLALLPFSVRYGVEARMYGLLLVLVMLMMLAVEVERIPALGFGVLGALAMLTHNTAFIYVAPLTVVFIARRKWAAWPMVIGWALYLPWLPYGLAQAGQVHQAFWIPPTTPGRVVGQLYALLFGSPHPVAVFIFPIVLALLIYGIAGICAVKEWRLLVYAVAPLVLLTLVSVVFRPMLQARLLYGSLPALLIVLSAGGLAWVDLMQRKLILEYRPIANTIYAVTLVAAMVFLLATTAFRTDWRDKLTLVDVSPKDTCYHISPTSIILAARYVDCHHVMWPHASNLEQHLTDETKTAMLIDMRFIEETQPAFGALWLWYGEGPLTTDAEKAEVERITTLYKPSEHYPLYSLDIADYTVWRLDNAEIAKTTH